MTVRFGVVGTAYWADAVHGSGLAATPGARLVGVWGRDRAKTQALAAKHGVAAFESFEALLAAVDAVSFAVPPAIQAALAPGAIAAGRHVLLEKPIATTHRDAAAIADALARRGLASMVFFTRRFVPEIAAVLAAEAGRPWTSARVEVRSAALDEGSPFAHSPWRRADGAALWDMGPHVLSVLVAMLGPVVASERLPAADRLVVRFATRHAHGARAEVTLTLHATKRTMGQSYRFTDATGDLVLPEPVFDRAAVFTRAARALVEAIASGTRGHPCDAAFGAEIVRILEAIDARPS